MKLRAYAWAVLPPLVCFAGLMAVAMALYPGGTWEQRGALGHSQARNFLCDLTRPIALNGQLNSGKHFADFSLLAFVVALGPFFVITPALFEDLPTLGRWVRRCGALCCVGGIVIVALPSYAVGPLLHGVFVLATAVPGLAAAFGATYGAFATRTPLRSIRIASVLTLLLALAAAVVFAAQLSRGDETTPGLPVLEKSAICASMAWMLLTVGTVLRRPRVALE